jgi:hypothetical protein
LSDHDGFVKATDTGALGPQRIDFYSGQGKESIYGPPHFGTESNHTIYFLARN